MKNKHTYTDHGMKRWLSAALAIATFGTFLLMTFGFNLLYNICNSDIILYTSILPEILTVLIDLCEVAVYAVSFSIILFALFLRMPSVGLVWLYVSASFFRRICDLAVALILNHSLNMGDVFLNGLYFLFDVLLVWGLFWIAHVRAQRYYKRLVLKSKASALFGSQESAPALPEIEALYPFKKIYSKENPLQGCALTVSIILSAVKVFDRILFDI